MNEVLIAGAGVAGSAAAVRLLECCFQPVIVSTGRPALPGAEAIPESGIRLLAKLGLESAVQAAGGVLVNGFESKWSTGEQPRRPAQFLHVERSRLAAALLRLAIHRGARLIECAALPKLSNDGGACSIRGYTALAAIDATGRSAAWSRPVRRAGRQVADLYRVAQPGPVRQGKVIQVNGGWAYAIGAAGQVTAALLTRRGAPRLRLTLEIAEKLELPFDDFQFLGRRPAFAQWAEEPVAGRRIAIGDAALAHDPISGQGVAFALSSALGAAEVINGWRVSMEAGAAGVRSYRSFVDQALQRHLTLLAILHDSPASVAADQVD